MCFLNFKTQHRRHGTRSGGAVVIPCNLAPHPRAFTKPSEDEKRGEDVKQEGKKTHRQTQRLTSSPTARKEGIRKHVENHLWGTSRQDHQGLRKILSSRKNRQGKKKGKKERGEKVKKTPNGIRAFRLKSPQCRATSEKDAIKNLEKS